MFRVVPINPLTRFDDLIDVLNDQLEIASNHIETGNFSQSMNLKNRMFSSLQPVKTSIPIGKNIANTKLYILDSNLNQLPPGAIGEIFIAGFGVSPGYLNLSDLNEKHFISNPFCSTDGFNVLYRTGDLGRWNAMGDIDYCGRADHQIKYHGNRIELDEIEFILTKLPQIAVAKVAVVEVNANHDIDDAEEYIVAYIQPEIKVVEGKSEAFKQSLCTELGRHLPGDHIPQKFCLIEHIPKLPNGKIDLNQCEQIYRQNQSLKGNI